MLDTAFPRPVGDIGNPATFNGNALFEIVPGAGVDAVLRTAGPSDGRLIAAFIAARDRLVARGARLVATSCGFLIVHQDRLQADCPVPVISSSLVQVGRRAAALPAGQRLAIITVDTARLSPAHLAACGAPATAVVGGVEHGRELLRVLAANRADMTLDLDAAARDVTEAGEGLLRRHPDIGAFVLECANMPPYRDALMRRVNRPVFDILTCIEELQ